MHTRLPLVSIIIPTKNSETFLKNTLESIQSQTYHHIETILVDGQSTDTTLSIAKKYKVRVLDYNPDVPSGYFDAPYRRNYGAMKAKGQYIYYVDADMELTPRVVEAAVNSCRGGADAVIIPEDSFGQGIWAKAKQMERRCYYGDDTVEAPRFFRTDIWKSLGGLDTTLGGGGDDWDMYQKLRDSGYITVRIREIVLHNEGNLSLIRLMKKRFMYGRDSAKYLRKRPIAAGRSYFPIRKGYITRLPIMLKEPVVFLAFVWMRICEYLAGFAGMIYGRTQ
jgi:glycosyltransferase involved in cell wall biosynthesis